MGASQAEVASTKLEWSILCATIPQVSQAALASTTLHTQPVLLRASGMGASQVAVIPTMLKRYFSHATSTLGYIYTPFYVLTQPPALHWRSISSFSINIDFVVIEYRLHFQRRDFATPFRD